MTEPVPPPPTRAVLTARDTGWALIVAALAGALYLATLQPDLGGPEDTPKFQFLGYVLGTAHPPGYPLYVMLSYVFVKLVPIGTIAYRANLFSAVMAAATCMLVFLIARLIGGRRWGAGCAALGLAAGASFWRSAVFAEVYSLAAAAAALSVLLLLLWGVHGGGRLLLGAIAATALAAGNHLTIVGVVPAYVLYVWLRDRKVLTVRFLAAAALLVALGMAQYGFIILRTRQRAGYLESRATTLSELIDIVTARRFAEQRFAFTLTTLVTVQLPVVTATIAQDLGPVGLALFACGLVAGVRRARSAAWLVIGAGVGMLVMVLNLGGDVKGFITPVMVFAWPFTAVGADALRQALASLSRRGAVAAVVAAATAAAMPLMNVSANYQESDQSGQTENAAFFRALHAQLPDGAGVVTEDYFYDMSLYYLRLTGEGSKSEPLLAVPFDAALVRAASAGRIPGDPAPRPRPVFAFAGAATFFAVEGLQFVPVTILGPLLDDWLARLPSGAVLVGATAYLPGPLDLAPVGHAAARSIGRPQNFETFAVVVRKPGARWNKHYEQASVVVDAGSLGAPLPAFGGTLRATADAGGVRVELGERTVVSGTSGVALAVFWPDGTLMRALDFSGSPPWKVPFHAAVYELAGDSPCREVSTDRWTDVTPVFSTGSAVATLLRLGTAVIETRVMEPAPVSTATAGIFGDAIGRDLEPGLSPEGVQLWQSELTRTGGRRSVFRLSVDRPGIRATAKLTSAVKGSTMLCAHQPIPFFRNGTDVDVIRPNFEAEAYFGAGWSGVEAAGTGRVRNGNSRATLLLPLEHGYSYRVTLDLSAPAGAETDLFLNGAVVGTCSTGAVTSCAVTLQPASTTTAVSALTLVTRTTHPPNPRRPVISLRGARIVRSRPAVAAVPPGR